MGSVITRRRRVRLLIGAVAVAGVGLTGTGMLGNSASAQEAELRVLGLTSAQELVEFSESDPGSTDVIGEISGLEMDTAIVGIDHRPATGGLYGLGDEGGVYTIDESDAAATLESRLDVDLVGNKHGIDFNPAVDRLRVVSDNGRNLRVNVDDGATIVDGTLNAPAAMPPVTKVRGVSGAAYTNNDADTNTATTLFVIDNSLDQVAIQAPANAGSLSPTGKLGRNAKSSIGFDIYSTIDNGTTGQLDAYAALGSGSGTAGFFEIDLLTGKATTIGFFDTEVVDIAIPLQQR